MRRLNTIIINEKLLSSSDGRYYCHNRRKYILKVHLVLVTKYRRKLLQYRITSDIKQWIVLLAKEKTWSIAAIETDKDHVHFLLDYDTAECVCGIVKSIKQMTTYKVWQKYSSVHVL